MANFFQAIDGSKVVELDENKAKMRGKSHETKQPPKDPSQPTKKPQDIISVAEGSKLKPDAPEFVPGKKCQ